MRSQGQAFGAQSRGGARAGEILIWAGAPGCRDCAEIASLRSTLFGDFCSFLLNCLLWQQWPTTALRASSSWWRQEGNNPSGIPAKLPWFRPQKPHRMYLAVKMMLLHVSVQWEKLQLLTPSSDPARCCGGSSLWDLGTQSQLQSSSQCTTEIPGRIMSCMQPALLQLDKSM